MEGQAGSGAWHTGQPGWWWYQGPLRCEWSRTGSACTLRAGGEKEGAGRVALPSALTSVLSSEFLFVWQAVLFSRLPRFWPTAKQGSSVGFCLQGARSAAPGKELPEGVPARTVPCIFFPDGGWSAQLRRSSQGIFPVDLSGSREQHGVGQRALLSLAQASHEAELLWKGCQKRRPCGLQRRSSPETSGRSPLSCLPGASDGGPEGRDGTPGR